MFASIEKYNGPAKVLLGLIALTFVGFGVSTVAAPGSDYIAKWAMKKSATMRSMLRCKMLKLPGDNSGRDVIFNSLLQRAYLIQGAKMMGISVSN